MAYTRGNRREVKVGLGYKGKTSPQKAESQFVGSWFTFFSFLPI